MKDKYYPPRFQLEEFHCPHCNTFAVQMWYQIFAQPSSWVLLDVYACQCGHCRKWAFWLDGKMIYPQSIHIEPPHEDLPRDCAVDYLEASDVFSKSPKASAALLRLCVQKLLIHLGEKGQIIDDDVASLIAKGMPVALQESLDYCRVIGNNAVHPGEIDWNDSPDIALSLFELINQLVEDRITRPGRIERAYDQLHVKHQSG